MRNNNVDLKTKMDQLVEHIKKSYSEIDELKLLLDERIGQLNLAYENKKQTIEKSINHMEIELKALFEKVDSKETKTQRKVILLSGDVILKKSFQTFEYDKKKLEEWAEINEPEFIETKEVKEFKWQEFKEKLVIQENQIIDIETGETIHIDGLEIKEVQEKLIIK